MFKKLILVVVLLTVLVLPAVAEETKMIAGAKADLPNLVRFTDNLTLGVEGGKDMYKNLLFDNKDWIEDDKGYFAYVKLTWTGSLLNFSK